MNGSGILVWLVMFFLLAPVPRALAEADLVKEYRLRFELLEREGKPDALLERSRWPGNDFLNSYLELELMQHPSQELTTQRLEAFFASWPHHAQADRLVRFMEKRVAEMDAASAEQWFARHPPKLQLARLRHVEILVGQNRLGEAFAPWRDLYREGAAVVVKAIDDEHIFWTRLSVSDHESRARAMLGKGGAVLEPILRYLPAQRRDLFLVLDAARRGDAGLGAMLKKVQLTESETRELWRERFETLHRSGAKTQLLTQLQGPEGQKLAPEDRHRWRYHYGRAKVFLDRDYQGALRLLLENVRDKGGALEDSLWLAGWSALQSGDRVQAEGLFMQLAKDGVSSQGRSQGAYWAARLAAEGERKLFWLRQAAKNLDNLHGLLAKEEADGFLPSLKSEDTGSCPDDHGRISPEEAGGLRLLQEVGRDWYNGPEIQKLGERYNLTPEEKLCLAIRYGAAELALKLGAEVQKKDRVIWRGLYPVPNWVPDGGWRLAPALVLGTSRQESQFYPRAESSAKALGVMQLIPDTATMEAKQSNFPPATRFRLQIPHYNMALGQAYMERMLKAFDGDLVLALCAYNAGPGRAREWQERRRKEDPMTFIENIPFTETRTYVKRVLTGVGIYRLQLDGKVSMRDYVAQGGPGLEALRPRPAP
ncbi:MAG: lytic transglycosylase domain-containing protein [Magnetococcales bacterium]|nr:lytic transglycosylase domain-containing protein [Magnetococcales bacterium]